RCCSCGLQRWLLSAKWGPARWTSRSQRTDLSAALVARRKRFPDRHFLAVVPYLPIQLNLTTRDGNANTVERIGFDTDVAGFLDEVVNWLHGAVDVFAEPALGDDVACESGASLGALSGR